MRQTWHHWWLGGERYVRITVRAIPGSRAVAGGYVACRYALPRPDVRRPSARFEVVTKGLPDDFGDGHTLVLGALCESCLEVRIQSNGFDG